MTKAAALFNFFSSFGIDAYEENSVYALEKQPDFPYITYELKTDCLSESDTMISFSVWYRSTSWTAANAMAETISKAIGYGGKVISCDDGYIWIKRGSPFAQSMGDPSDDMIKRKYCTLSVSFLTRD